jgi:hypothetical protein
MMWTLPKPNNDDAIDNLKTAFTKADGTETYPLTQAEKDEIKKIYSKYDDSLGRPKVELEGPSLSAELKDALYLAYTEVQEGRRLQRLRDRIKLLALRCPLCGIGPATDLDHHLPRSRFKGLSIYVRNLVPMCHSCNNKKRTVAGDTPDQQFIHAYFDTLPQERFLVANVSVSDSGITVDFKVNHTATMPQDIYDRISFQLDRLNLVERYRPEVNVFLESQKDSFELVFGAEKNAEQLRNFLIRSANSHERSFGLNDWRTALFHGLAACDAFCTGGFRMVFALRSDAGQTVGA